MKSISSRKPKVVAKQCLYIKLGTNGKWEKDCIEESQTIRLSYREYGHELCLKRKWNDVHELCRSHSKSEGAATTHLNQLKYFYEADAETLWFTFFKGRLYWCFASNKIELLDDGTKIRKCASPWTSKDLNGNDLLISGLSGKLTRTQGYRQTICPTKVEEYLLRRINGEVVESVDFAQKSLEQLEGAVEALISDLTPKDFELLVELVFSNTGWIRVGAAGGTERDIDLELLSPVTNERVAVQIKSNATQAILNDYIDRFSNWDVHQFFFVYHTSSGKISNSKDAAFVKLVDVKQLSKLVINAGLASWVIEKAA